MLASGSLENVLHALPNALFPLSKKVRLSTLTSAVSHGKDIQGRGAVGSENVTST